MIIKHHLYHYVGAIHFKKGEYDKALIQFEKAYKIRKVAQGDGDA